ncbi:hypothetical protein SAMN04489844_3683 [Nocardioides exalbidus]|uniref:Hemolysin-type calcium-binding repeat-containing protein n=1 Tax=Nocardioides exalbidus TaxID=402596 RepID=A0A1H4Y076_9ACTN|nr:hypothetical protein [Nocardioides exalbidus]SED10488.1 hypothetical protein SAMN04489844_3683 [Nocardioides exalbidus]
MPRRPRPVIALAVAAVAAVAPCLAAPPGHAAAPSTCLGKAVTIVATSTVTEGTEGDDVVAVEPGAWTRFDAKGGDDTICIDVPASIVTDHHGGRDMIASLDAGAGDDIVANLMSAGTSGVITTVVLGLGNDTFTGADVGESVSTERVAGGSVTPTTDPQLLGEQRDVVTGAATVFSSAPVDGPSHDRITFGSGDARAVIDGVMAPDGLLDVSAASTAGLELPLPDRSRPVAYGGVLVDNQARQVVAGDPTLRWVGDFQTIEIGSPTRVLGAPVSFLGTDIDETVTFRDAQAGDVVLGGGDDSLTVQGLNLATLPQSAHGGGGRNTAYFEVPCRQSLVVRLDNEASCDGRSGDFTGFHTVAAGTTGVAAPAVRLVGTSRRDELRAFGSRAAVDGGRGADVIDAIAPVVRVRAGDGADRVFAAGLDVVARGQAGPDRIEVVGGEGRFESGVKHRRRVALGGPGADKLVGADDARADRLVGGKGRDRADGGKGRRDYCSAEVTRRCERP